MGMAQTTTHNLGDFLPYSPPKDSTYFSNVFMYYSIADGSIDSFMVDMHSLTPNLRQSGYIPAPLKDAPEEMDQVKVFSNLSAAYTYSNYPNYPMSAVVRIEMYGPGNVLQGTCSGSLINKNTVLSAAHCVHYPPNVWQNITGIKITPAYDNGNAPYGSVWATGFWIPNNWVNNTDWNYDMLVINLTGDLGLSTGYLGWWANDANTSVFLNSSSTFNTFGYPATTLGGSPVFDYGERMWHMQGYFDFFGNGSLGTNCVYHNNQGYKGLSGSNTYLYQNGERYVMAILSHGFDPPSYPNSITGHVRLNNFLGNFIYYYAPEVGIENTVSSTLHVFPVPATDDVFIQGLNASEDYVLFNVSGQPVATGKTTGNISVEHLPAGIYFLNILQHSYKIIVQH